MTESLNTQYYIIEGNGSVSFTPEGVKHYLPYFDRLGIDITIIRTISRLAIAIRLARSLMLEDVEQALASRPQTIESRWLQAQIRGDAQECQRLETILTRKHEQRLRIIR